MNHSLSKTALFIGISLNCVFGIETITGRAISTSSAPLTGVKVVLSQLKLADTTLADGIFEFKIPSAEAIAVKHLLVPSFSIKGNMLDFTISQSQKVTIEFFDIQGKHAKSVLNRFLQQGQYGFNLNDAAADLSSGTYFVSVTIGTTSAHAKFMIANRTIQMTTPANTATTSDPMAKRLVDFAQTDTVVCSKSGYFTIRKPLATLTTQNLGDIIVDQDKIMVGNTTQDQYDMFIVQSVAASGMDSSMAMIIKAMIVIESGFNVQAISMWDTQLPCGTHSYGLIQVTPGCVSGYATLPASTAPTATISGGLNGVKPVLTYANKADSASGNTIVKESNFVIDLVSNPANPLYATSAFNPAYCIDHGAKTVAGVMSEMKTKFKTCTAANYVSMTLAGYNQGSGTVTGCSTYNVNGQNYANSALTQYRTFCSKAGITPLY